MDEATQGSTANGDLPETVATTKTKQPMSTQNPQQRVKSFAGAPNVARTPRNPATVSEALKSEITAYCRSGAIDACECCMIAMEQVGRRFGLTFRQCEQLFVELA